MCRNGLTTSKHIYLPEMGEQEPLHFISWENIMFLEIVSFLGGGVRALIVYPGLLYLLILPHEN